MSDNKKRSADEMNHDNDHDKADGSTDADAKRPCKVWDYWRLASSGSNSAYWKAEEERIKEEIKSVKASLEFVQAQKPNLEKCGYEGEVKGANELEATLKLKIEKEERNLKHAQNHACKNPIIATFRFINKKFNLKVGRVEKEYYY